MHAASGREDTSATLLNQILSQSQALSLKQLLKPLCLLQGDKHRNNFRYQHRHSLPSAQPNSHALVRLRMAHCCFLLSTESECLALVKPHAPQGLEQNEFWRMSLGTGTRGSMLRKSPSLSECPAFSLRNRSFHYSALHQTLHTTTP